MDCKTVTEKDATTVYLVGELDHHHAAVLRERVDTVVRERCPRMLVLDFSGITFMDSSGIGFVMGRYKLMQSVEGELRIRGASPRMEKVMRLAGLERLPIWSGKE